MALAPSQGCSRFWAQTTKAPRRQGWSRFLLDMGAFSVPGLCVGTQAICATLYAEAAPLSMHDVRPDAVVLFLVGACYTMVVTPRIQRCIWVRLLLPG